MNPKLLLLLALGAFTAFYLVTWIVALLRQRREPPGSPDEVGPPTVRHVAIGFVTNFFDTLGIGSYAPTTAVFRLWKLVPDERIPGTLNVGHTLPTITQAFIFISIVEVEFKTLVLLILASVLGAWLGAGVVARMPRRQIQGGMGAALLVAALLFTMTNLKLMPGGGDALSLPTTKLVLGFAGNFLLGALMTLGIGLYAPCMILISLLGMNPKAAFPIMMGSCAFLMPVAAARFVRAKKYSVRPALGLGLAGIPAVLIAAFIVKALPLTVVRWLVVAVVLYTAIGLIRAALRGDLLAPHPDEAGAG